MQFEAAGFDLLAYGNPSKLPLGLVLPADATLRQSSRYARLGVKWSF